MNALLHLTLLVGSYADPAAAVVSLAKGAGVVIDQRGYVVTCWHVVSAESDFLVRTRDGRLFVGRVVARDTGRELALVKLETSCRFLPARLSPTAPRIRELVTAVGHPKGLEWTISGGQVTGLNRTIRMGESVAFSGLVQTDASINPGNSGGGLFSVRGELLGLPLAVHDGAQGIAFAVPEAHIREFLATHLPK